MSIITPEGMIYISEGDSALGVPNVSPVEYAKLRQFNEKNTSIETKNGRLKIKLPATILDKENLNKRVYPTALMKEVCEDQELQYKAENGYLLGAGDDHPQTSHVPPIKASHMITKVWVENIEGQNMLMNIWETLDTSHGKDLRALFESGAAVGVSIRGFGSVGDNSPNPNQGTLQSYKFLGTDAVGDPSAQIYAGVKVPNVVLLDYVDRRIAVEAKELDEADMKYKVDENKMGMDQEDSLKTTGPAPDGHTHKYDPNAAANDTTTMTNDHKHEYDNRDGTTQPGGKDNHTHTLPDTPEMNQMTPGKKSTEDTDVNKEVISETDVDETVEDGEYTLESGDTIVVKDGKIVEKKKMKKEQDDEDDKDKDGDDDNGDDNGSDDDNGNGDKDKDDDDEDKEENKKSKKEGVTLSQSIPTDTTGDVLNKKDKKKEEQDEEKELSEWFDVIREVHAVDEDRAKEMIVSLESSIAEAADEKKDAFEDLKKLKGFKTELCGGRKDVRRERMHGRRRHEDDDMDDEDDMMYDDDMYDDEWMEAIKTALDRDDIETTREAITGLIDGFEEAHEDKEGAYELIEALRAFVAKDYSTLKESKEMQDELITSLRTSLRARAIPANENRYTSHEVKEAADSLLNVNVKLCAYKQELYGADSVADVTARAKKYIEGINREPGDTSRLAVPNVGFRPTSGESGLPRGWV